MGVGHGYEGCTLRFANLFFVCCGEKDRGCGFVVRRGIYIEVWYESLKALCG